MSLNPMVYSVVMPVCNDKRDLKKAIDSMQP